MARRGDGLYERGKGNIKRWYLDAIINGTRYQVRLGKGLPAGEDFRRVAAHAPPYIREPLGDGGRGPADGAGTRRLADDRDGRAVRSSLARSQGPGGRADRVAGIFRS